MNEHPGRFRRPGAAFLPSVLGLAWVAVGCGHGPERPDEQGTPKTEVLRAGEAVCGTAGSNSAPCRLKWLRQHPSQGTRDARLAFCADDTCRLHVLTESPVSELDAALRDCRLFAPSLGASCTRQALDRWASGQPEQAVLGRVAVRPDVDPHDLGVALGTVVRCVPRRSCTGPAAVSAACEATVRRHQGRPCPGVSVEFERRPARSGQPGAPAPAPTQTAPRTAPPP